MPTLVELIKLDPWREAITYRETWSHEYVLTEKDGQRELLAAVCERFRAGEGVPCRFLMASPDKALEDLTTKRKLYQELGIREYWRLDPTGGDLYGSPLSADRLEGGAYRPIPLHKLEGGQSVGPQRGNRDRPFLDERDLRVPGS